MHAGLFQHDPEQAPLVLLVEDHTDSRDMYAAGLRHAGFTVEPADTPAAALAAVLSRRVDVVVVDYSMPNMSGADLAARLRRQPATAEARYVLVTGHGADALRSAAATVHFDAMVKKPIASDQLARVLRRVLQPVRPK